MESLLLTRRVLRELVDRIGLDRLMDQAIDAIHQACLDFDAAQCDSPARDGFHYTKPVNGLIEWMPFMHSRERVTIKTVGYHPSNPGRYQVPTILSNVATYDTTTGRLVALMDGAFLTALRTGAASAVASRVLADPNSKTLGLVGCGAQAVTQLHALAHRFPFSRVLVHDRDAQVAASFRERVSDLEIDGCEIKPAETRTILAESDIVCTATSVEVGAGPVIPDAPTRPGVHINAIGSDLPGKFELPMSLLERAFVCADFPEQAMIEGECQRLQKDQVDTDLVGLVKGAEGFQRHRFGLSVFDSTGWAMEDHVAAELLIDHALALGIGERVEFEGEAGEDPFNPYAFLRADSDRAAGVNVAAPSSSTPSVDDERG